MVLTLREEKKSSCSIRFLSRFIANGRVLDGNYNDLDTTSVIQIEKTIRNMKEGSSRKALNFKNLPYTMFYLNARGTYEKGEKNKKIEILDKSNSITNSYIREGEKSESKVSGKLESAVTKLKNTKSFIDQAVLLEKSRIFEKSALEMLE